MGLLDEVRAESPRKGPVCAVATLGDELRNEVDEVLAQVDKRTITFKAVSRVLKGRGHEIASGTLSRHARRECNCDAR